MKGNTASWALAMMAVLFFLGSCSKNREIGKNDPIPLVIQTSTGMEMGI